MGISVWSLVWRDAESQMNPFTNPFHFLFFPVRTEPELKEAPPQQGRSMRKAVLLKTSRSKAYFRPSDVHGRLAITKSAWRSCPHFVFPSDPRCSLALFRLTHPS